MNKYELALVLNGRLEEDAKAAALEKFQGYITRFNGTVTGIEDYFIKFESEEAACPNEVEARLRIYEPVLRYLIVSDEAE